MPGNAPSAVGGRRASGASGGTSAFRASPARTPERPSRRRPSPAPGLTAQTGPPGRRAMRVGSAARRTARSAPRSAERASDTAAHARRQHEKPDRDADDRKRVHPEQRTRVADKVLRQRNVACQARHDAAGPVRVEERQRQALDMLVQVVAQLEDDTLPTDPDQPSRAERR